MVEDQKYIKERALVEDWDKNHQCNLNPLSCFRTHFPWAPGNEKSLPKDSMVRDLLEPL